MYQVFSVAEVEDNTGHSDYGKYPYFSQTFMTYAGTKSWIYSSEGLEVFKMWRRPL
jgi:hypothetical protein